MPRISRELSALEVRRLTHPGSGRNVTIAVGGVAGLLLQLTPTGGRTWILRVTIGVKRREIGLGSYPEVPLAQARERARAAKNDIRNGKDPVEDRRAARAAITAAHRQKLTFATAVDRYLAMKVTSFRNPKHQDQWRNTLHQYAHPLLGNMLVQDIQVRDVLQVLEPIWSSRTETASRLRGRIEAVLTWATVAGHRKGDNPARWVGNLKELLPPAVKVKKGTNHPALQIKDAPRWFSQLRGREGLGSRALEFLALTAARSQEVRGASWDEVDLEAGLWCVPAARMKMDREHRVPLSPQALQLLRSLPRSAAPLVFPAPRGGEMSDMTLSATMKRMHAAAVMADRTGYVDRISKRPAVPHGLRSTFRDWVAEQTSYPGEMAELALAHKIGNSVEAAYRRGDMIEKRRQMMTDWTRFLTGDAKSREGDMT